MDFQLSEIQWDGQFSNARRVVQTLAAHLLRLEPSDVRLLALLSLWLRLDGHVRVHCRRLLRLPLGFSFYSKLMERIKQAATTARPQIIAA